MKIQDLLKECDYAYFKDDFKELLELSDEVLKTDPDNQIAIGYKSCAYCFLNHPEKTVEILEEAMRKYPRNYYFKNNIAMAYYDLGEYEKSLKLCEEGLKIKDFDWLCENKLKNLIKLDRMDEAIEFDKTFNHSFVNLGTVLLAEGRISDALKYYCANLKEHPDDISLVDQIKWIIWQNDLDETPDVGDYYLKWIDSITSVEISSDCDEFDLECISVECGDSKFEPYAQYEVFVLLSRFRYSDCIKSDDLKESLMFDDVEFDAFMSRLNEIGFLCEPSKGNFELKSGLINHVMDDEKLNELKKQTEVDNTRLEELMRHEITPQMENEFFEILKESRLYLPIDFGPDSFDGIENAKPGDEIEGPSGFDIQFLKDAEGRKAVPLFTSEEMMKKAGAMTSVMAIHMSDLADMLKQTDKYSVIAINPFTEFDLNMPVEAFVNLFNPINNFEEMLKTMLKLLKEKSIELDDDYAFFVRDDVDFMKEDAVDGVFRPNIPFNVSGREDFCNEMKYLNILLMAKSKKVLFIGDIVGEDGYDTVIAPGTEFEFVKDLDEFTRVWKCGAQPFYDE